jgi:hypothetical protein
MVLGKPLTAADGGSGFVPAATLHSWIANASSPQAVAGVMAWSWETTEGPAWIHTVYGAPCNPVYLCALHAWMARGIWARGSMYMPVCRSSRMSSG